MPQVVFITGCSSGLGFSTATKLVKEGYIVYATIRSQKNKEKLERACGLSKLLHILTLDLTKDADIKKAVNEVLTRHGRIDVLVHNAAAALIGPVDSAAPEEVDYLFKVNVSSMIRLTQLFLPQMRKQKSGHIVIVSSVSGIESSAYLGVYAATKFAQEALANSWATTLHKWNIKTTILEPGAMNTNLPHSIPIGSYYNSLQEDPYKQFNQNALNFLKECLKNGTNPDQVAEIISEILKEPEPHLRYQTCEFSKNLVNRHLREPDGHKWIEEHRKFVESFYRKL